MPESAENLCAVFFTTDELSVLLKGLRLVMVWKITVYSDPFSYALQ